MSLKHNIELEAQYSKYIIKPLCWLSLIGHPSYWLIWTYIFPQPYDSLTLRLSASFFSAIILLKKYWPQSLKKHFPIIWVIHGAFILPFLFTFIGLKNQFNFVWSICHMGMIFLLILYTAQIVTILLSAFIGTTAGLMLYLFSYYPKSLDWFPTEYTPLFLFGIITGVLLNYYSMKGISEYESKLVLEKQKSLSMKSLAGSIAHEMRNPLSQIHGAIHLLKNHNKSNNDEFHTYYEDVIDVINNSHQIINLTMDAINEKPIQKDRFQIISALDICNEAVSEYAYKDSNYRKKVSVAGDDFQILADPVLVKYILYNLIGNALYYIQSNPKANIDITLKEEQRKIEVRDTGPGIAPENLSQLFDSFFTSGKSGGTGLGLAYCKRTMLALDGDIHCISELGKFTSFILTFPAQPPQLRVVKETIYTDY